MYEGLPCRNASSNLSFLCFLICFVAGFASCRFGSRFLCDSSLLAAPLLADIYSCGASASLICLLHLSADSARLVEATPLEAISCILCLGPLTL